MESSSDSDCRWSLSLSCLCPRVGAFRAVVSLCATKKSSAGRDCWYMLFFPPPRWSTATQCGYWVSEPLARHTGGQGWVGGGVERRMGGRGPGGGEVQYSHSFIRLAATRVWVNTRDANKTDLWAKCIQAESYFWHIVFLIDQFISSERNDLHSWQSNSLLLN